MVQWHSWNKTNAFAGLNPSDFPHETEGFWRHYDPMWHDLLVALRPDYFLEIGSFKGRTAIQVAETIKLLQLSTKVICVDTWIGSPEHWKTDHDPYWQIETKFGYPTLYYNFAANVVEAGFQDVIVPLPSTSESAVVILQEAAVKPSIIFVDAAHEYEPALRDFHLYWDLLASPGALVCDDYAGPGWDGVTRAGDQFVKDVGRPATSKVGKLVVGKGDISFSFNADGGLVVL